MVVHSEFFEFESRGEFDVVKITSRVEEAVQRSDIVPVRGVQDLIDRWAPFRSLT